MNITETINNYIDLLVKQEESEEKNSISDQLIESEIKYQKELSTYSFQEQLTILNQMRIKHDELQSRITSLKAKKAISSLQVENEVNIIDKVYKEFLKQTEEIDLYLEKMNLVINNLEHKLLRQLNKEQIISNTQEQSYVRI